MICKFLDEIFQYVSNKPFLYGNHIFQGWTNSDLDQGICKLILGTDNFLKLHLAVVYIFTVPPGYKTFSKEFKLR